MFLHIDSQPIKIISYFRCMSFHVIVLLSTGAFLGFFPDVSDADITAMCEDGLRGRRLLCGNEQGRYYLINFTDGSVIDELKVHTKGIINEMKAHTLEITSLVCRR